MKTAADPTPRTSAVPVTAHPVLRVLPLATLTAASVFNYSLPGLLWIGAIGVVVVAARLFVVKPKPELPPDWKRKFAPYAIGAVVLVLLATVQEWSRIADFARLQALNPERFGSDLGNLKGSISPLEALGIWPTGDYRTAAERRRRPDDRLLRAGAARRRRRSSPGSSTPAGARSGRCRRRSLAVAGVWALTAAFSTPYIAAKALAIAAPLVMLIAVRGVLSLRGPLITGLAVLFIGAAGVSSFLALRQAAVGPDSHANELAEVRDAVQGEPVLFLGRDDFIGYELAGSDEITGIVANYYSVEDARSRFKKGDGGGEKFDVDALFPQTLDDFKWILATSGQPRSGAPPRFIPRVETDNYILYENTGRTGKPQDARRGHLPGRLPEVRHAGDPQGVHRQGHDDGVEEDRR